MRTRQKVGSVLWKLRTMLTGRSRPESSDEEIVAAFHRLYYNLAGVNRTWADTRWLGARAGKNPMDAWVYQEILFELRPDLIVECGCAEGGGALFLATICDAIQHGRVISIDVDERPVPKHPRIQHIWHSSTSDSAVSSVRKAASDAATVLILLDSDHSKGHVLDEMRVYSEFVSPGSYLIVEDTNVNGNPVFPEHGPGPFEAVQSFLKENGDFEIDRDREKFLFTFNPSGYLKKRGEPVAR